MTIAFLDVWHSRPIAPTRRVALGDYDLPTDPAPGPGGLLLGAVIARFAPSLDRDILAEMKTLMDEVERGDQIGQPRLRHRFQDDIVGLSKSTHRVIAGDEGLRFELEMHLCLPAQSALAAVYACEKIPLKRRPQVVDVLRRGLEWVGPLGPGLIDHLVGRDVAMQFRSGEYATASSPILWAHSILELEVSTEVDVKQVQRSYRRLLRDAHPDHGAHEHDAADRIAELTRARDLLLA